MEGIVIKHLNKFKPSTIRMGKFHHHSSNKSDQDTRTTATHLHIFICLFSYEGFTTPFLKTTWDHTDGCTKQYHCKNSIYLLYCLDL